MGCWKVSLLYFLLKHFTLLSSAFLLCTKHQFDPTSGMDMLANGYVRNGLRSARVICDLLISEHGASGKRFITEKPHIFYDVCRSIKSNENIETTHISIDDRYYLQSLEFSFLLYYSFFYWHHLRSERPRLQIYELAVLRQLRPNAPQAMRRSTRNTEELHA